jgi:hypothetical protein
MVRLLAAILITCCLTAQLGAQDSKEQAPKEQTSKEQAPKEQEAPAQPTAAPPAAAPSAPAQFPMDAFTEFSAVMVGSVRRGDDQESYIYRSGNLVRTPGPQGLGYFITDLTTLETYAISTTGCLHDRNPYYRSAPFSSMRPGYTVERTVTGQETVDGHACKIEDVTLSSPKLPTTIKLRFWEADDLKGFPIKVEYLRPRGHNPVIQYKNVVLGPQDPTLFIHPKSCESLSTGRGMGGGTIKPKAAPGAKKPAAPAPH